MPNTISIGAYRQTSCRARTISQVAENEDSSREEIADSVFAMIRFHGHSIRSVARTWGISDGEALDFFLEGDARYEDRAIKAAYRAGRLSVMPPPTVGMRRAA